jgi:hypothetical protein
MEQDFKEHMARLRAQSQSQVRSQPEIERNPSSYQRQVEREGRSTWSGGSFGGGTWGGRSRSEGEQP